MQQLCHGLLPFKNKHEIHISPAGERDAVLTASSVDNEPVRRLLHHFQSDGRFVGSRQTVASAMPVRRLFRQFQSDGCFFGSSQLAASLFQSDGRFIIPVRRLIHPCQSDGCFIVPVRRLLHPFQSDGCFVGSSQMVALSVPVRRSPLACLFLGGDVDWRSSLLASRCTARLRAGNGQGTLTHFRTFLFDGRLLFGERDDSSSPLPE